MMYLGDFPADQAINFMWNTNDASGASITRATDGTLSVYKDNSDGSSFDVTQVTTGITNDEDFDGLTGVHSCCITTTNAWYEIGHDYTVVLSASTVDGEIINAVVAHFSIENRYTRGTDSAALATTALSNVTWTAAKAGHINADISSRSSHTAANVWSVATRALTDKAGFSLSTAGIKAIWDQLTNVLTTVGSIGKLLVDNINATISSRNSTTPPTVEQIRTEMDTNSTKMAPSQTLADYKATGFNTVVPDAAGTAATPAEVATALTDINLDHLVKIAVDTNFATTVHLDSVVGQLADVGTSATFNRTTDALEAIRNKQTDIETDTAEIGTAGAGLTDLGGMSTGMKTEVNDQVVDVVKTDTTSEMSQAAPPATPTFEEMFAYIYFMFRNKNVETSTEHAVYDNDGTTKLFKAAMSDTTGTLTKDEFVSGA